MAFPTRPPLVQVFHLAQQVARNVKDRAERDGASMAAGDVTRASVRALLENLARARADLLQIETTPGLLQYVRDQYADVGMDVVQEWQNMRTEIDSVGAWIITNYPRSANGALEELTLSAQGVVAELTFTSAQTLGLRTRLAALAATIE